MFQDRYILAGFVINAPGKQVNCYRESKAHDETARVIGMDVHSVCVHPKGFKDTNGDYKGC